MCISPPYLSSTLKCYNLSSPLNIMLQKVTILKTPKTSLSLSLPLVYISTVDSLLLNAS